MATIQEILDNINASKSNNVNNNSFIDLMRQISGNPEDATAPVNDANSIYGHIVQMYTELFDGSTNYEEIVANIDAIRDVFNNLEIINSLNDIKAALESIFADKSTLDSIFADKLTLDSLYADKSKLDSLFADKIKFDRIHGSIDNIDRVYQSIDNIDTAIESAANINILANSIQSVIATAAIDAEVVIVANSAPEIITLADNMNALNEIYINRDEIYAADDNAVIATTKAIEASNSAAVSASNASAALISKDAARVSETNALIYKNNASASATTATTKASEASDSADGAAQSETEAITKAAEASQSAANALISKNAASVSESNAAVSESNAANSASAAAVSESTTLNYKNDVSAMKLAVETLYDAFDDRFLGAKISDPIVDNDGDAILDGAMYFDITTNVMKVYDIDTTSWYTIPQKYLSQLLDVELTSIATGHMLKWDGENWINYLITKSDVGLSNVDNTSDANKPVSTVQQIALNLKANTESPTFTGTVSGITKSMVGLALADNTADSAKNVLSATKLTTARTIGGVSFDGTANINLAGVNITGNQDTTGNAGTATKWATARTITLAGDVTGSVSIDGTANVSIATTVAANSVALGTDTTGNYVAGNTAGTGIVVSGTAGEGWNPTIALSNVGTSGTYRSVTTDAQGRVTAGTNPTTVAGYGLTDAYTKTEVDTKISNLVDSSPETLNTLNELAAALGDDPNFATTVTNSIGTKVTANTAIAAGTGTKVTYDAKGLVTSSTTLAATDIPSLDTGKLTTGILPVLRGGTGVATSTGTGSTVLSTSPVLTTPNIGVATGSVTGNAGTATKLATARTITLSGDVAGSTTFDGSGNVVITTIIADDSHNHTITNVDGLQTVLDGKVDDSQVLTNVPLGAVFTDTIYTHPSTHTATMITEDATHRFATDAEKAIWNAKASTNIVTTSVDGLMSSTDKSKLNGVETGATADQTAAEIKTALLTVDGAGSGIDADLLDGQHGSYYSPASHNHTLDSLSNTTITTNTTGEILKWSGTAWINNTLAEAGIQPASTAITTANVGSQAVSYATSAGAITGQGSLATLSTVGAGEITDNSVGAAELNVVGNGTASQYLRSDGDGTFTWATPTDTNTTYTAGAGLSLTGTVFANASPNVSTNLSYATAATTGTVVSSDGTNATIPAATTSLAGLMTNADKTKLNGIASGAQVNVATNLSVTAGTTAGPTINSSTGTNVVIPSASATASGIIDTTTQTIAGAKTFSSTITGSVTGNAGTATALTSGDKTISGTLTLSGSGSYRGISLVSSSTSWAYQEYKSGTNIFHLAFSSVAQTGAPANSMHFRPNGSTTQMYVGPSEVGVNTNLNVTGLVNLGSTQQASVQYNSTDNSIDFIIN